MGTPSNVDARARYDQGRQSDYHGAHDSTGANPEDTTQSNEDGMAECPFILDYLATIPLSQEDANRFHFAPNIPHTKLSKALACRRYYATKSPNQVYLLIDDTLFGGGADGLLITDDIISFKSAFLDSNDFHYSMGWNGGFYLEGTTINRFDKACKVFTQISLPTVQNLVWGINQFFADRFAWLVCMALRGDVDSQFKLSLSCHENPEEEFRWLTMAAKNGHVSAQHNLGKHYQYKDPQSAFEWLTKAARQGSTNSQRELKSDIFKQFY